MTRITRRRPARPRGRQGVLVWALLAGLGLAGCDGDGASGAPGAGGVDPAQLCVASDCGSKTVLLTIPDAENLLFTPDGRLFVSGGTNVHEVTRSGDAWSARPLLEGSCNFTGLAQRGDVLYAACFDGTLYAARLTAAPALQPIHDLNMASANGMAVGPSGELYVVNGPVSTSGLPDPRIVRLRFSVADPFAVTEQVDWLTTGLSHPNGLVARGATLSFTDSSELPPVPGAVREVPILPDGRAGEVRTLTEALDSLPDDLGLAGDHLLVTLYSAGALALVAPDGTIVQRSDDLAFDSPSSVRLGQAPLFAPADLVVTEKGLIGDNDGPIGNVLSVYRRTAQ